MVDSKSREVTLPDGSSVNVIESDFQAIKELWNEYELPDGTKLRVKNIVMKVFRVVDKDGNQLYDATGDPQVIINGTLAVTTKEEVRE